MVAALGLNGGRLFAGPGASPHVRDVSLSCGERCGDLKPSTRQCLSEDCGAEREFLFGRANTPATSLEKGRRFRRRCGCFLDAVDAHGAAN